MYHILNPEGFCDSVRKEVLKSYGLPDDEDHLTNNQVMKLLDERCEKDDDGYLGDDESLNMIVEAAQNIVIGMCLSSMAASGELETAWDSEKNEPVFWRKA